MKPTFQSKSRNPFLRSALITAAVFGLATASQAATFTWDGTNGENWGTAHWTGAGSSWVDSSSNDAVINGGTVFAGSNGGSGSSGSVTANSITVSNATLRPTSDNVFWNSVSTITLNAGAVLNGGYNASNHITSAIVLNGGEIGGGDTGGAAAIYGIYNFENTIHVTDNSTISVSGAGATLGQSGGTQFNVDSGKTLSVTGTLVHKGASSDTGLIKTGDGTMVLSGANSYTGSTTVSQGTLKIEGTIRDTSGIVVTGATLDIAATNALTGGHRVAMNAPITINAGGVVLNSNNSLNRIGDINLNGGTLTATYNDGNYGSFFIGQANGVDPTVTVGGSVASTINGSGNIKMWSNVNFNVADVTGDANADLTVSAALGNQTPDQGSAAAGITKSGVGTMVLSGINTYTGGTTVNQGTLKLELGNRSGNDSLGSFSVTSGAILNLDNTNTTVGSYYPQNFVLSGAGTVTKTGVGSIDLWNGSSLTGFTGTMDVQQGSLRLNNITTGGNMSQATLNIASGATFDVRYNASLSVDKLTGSGTLDQSYNGGSGLSVTVGSNNGSSAFGGVIQNSSGQPISLTKTGSGTFTLSGTNSYTGDTTVNGGTLSLSSAYLNDTATVSIASGAVLNLTHGLTDIVGALVINGTPLANGTYTASSPATSGYITGAGSIQVGPNPADPFLAWIDATWPTLSNKTPTGDPDNDGISNLVEYVLKNGDPSASNPGILPTVSASGANLVFTYLRRTAATDTIQTFQYGNNLTGWTDVAVAENPGPGVTVAITTPEAGIEQVAITVPKGANTKLFGRLQVVK